MARSLICYSEPEPAGMRGSHWPVFIFTLHVRCPDAAAIGTGQEIKRQGRWIQDLAAFSFCFVFINTKAGSRTEQDRAGRATGMALPQNSCHPDPGGHPQSPSPHERLSATNWCQMGNSGSGPQPREQSSSPHAAATPAPTLDPPA